MGTTQIINALNWKLFIIIKIISIQFCIAQVAKDRLINKKAASADATPKNKDIYAKLKIDNQHDYITFSVQNVEPAKRLLYEVNYTEKVKDRMYYFLNKNEDALIKDTSAKSNEELLCLATKNYKLIDSHSHSFINALSIAYSDHRPVTISPDMVWLMIVQGFANHISENSESLRNYFVNFKGKKNLDVEVQESFNFNSTLDWSNVLIEFKDQIKSNVGDGTVSLIEGNFSTTTKVEDFAFNIALMNSMSPYFTYSLSILCGIPEIKIEGTLEDWKLIQAKAVQLEKYDLQWWTKDLMPLLNEIVNARSGNINQDFWSNIFQINSISDGGCSTINYLTGWIIKFFPYILVNGKYIRNPTIGVSDKDLLKISKPNISRNGISSIRKYADKMIMFKNIPNGISKAELLVAIAKDKTYRKFSLFSGFVGVSQDHNTYSLKPEISWGVTDTKELPTEQDIKNYLNAKKR